MRIACIYWSTSSVGGIDTHLNTLRAAAIRFGDTFDILHSSNWRTKMPNLFPERKWIRGGDTRIWVDGEIPQTAEAAKWLESKYDAMVFGFICPHPTKAYPTPDFLPLYETRLPKVAWVMDGYWEEYAEWAHPLLPKLDGVLCPLESYATPLRRLKLKNLVISPFPFAPAIGPSAPRSSEPLLVWPNQWKNIKGVNHFVEVIPSLPPDIRVELYSNGIRYYQMRTEERWRAAVGEDRFQGFNGTGRATFFGNVGRPQIVSALQRAWFTANLQGISTRKETYKRGSYNNTEVEALFYGALPILYSSAKKTDIPPGVYLAVDRADEIPGLIVESILSGFATSPDRRRLAREFVLRKHRASDRYQELRGLLA